MATMTDGQTGKPWTALRRLPRETKLGGLVALGLIVAGAAWLAPPLGEVGSWMDFADTRPFGPIPYFGDLVSNIGFLIVGLLGLAWLFGDGRDLFIDKAERLPWAVFFLGSLLIAAGSSWFHWNPTTDTLVWDRLAMTVCFMALTAGTLADRLDRRVGLVALPVLLAAGLASVLYWDMTAQAGRPDLRFYGVVQFFPMVLIPLLVALFPGRLTDGRHIAGVFAWYGLAKLLEIGDGLVFEALGQTVSGHTLKHLAAAVGIWWVLRMLREAPKPGTLQG